MKNIKQQIINIRKRWANEKQRELQQREADERDLWRRCRDALLQEKREFVLPCECDEFLTNVLEGRKPECPHYDGTGLFWWLAKQRF